MDAKKVLIDKDEMYKKFKESADTAENNICFIIGAGASRGYSSHDAVDTSPIVAELFDDNNTIVREVIRRSEHSFILRHRDFLKRKLRRYSDDLEEYLGYLYSRNGDDDFFASLLFYLQDLFYTASDRVADTNNNYKDLIDQLFTSRGKDPWSCISFNYDTLLEQSYILAERDRLRDFKSLESYKNYPKILKVHGSVNFRYTLANGMENQTKSEKDIFGLMMDGKKEKGELIQIFDPKLKSKSNPSFHDLTIMSDEQGKRRRAHVYNFPLMMIPIHASSRPKHVLFSDMLAEAKKEIEKSSLIVAIGYNFGDELFRKELATLDLSKKTLVLVGTSRLSEDYNNHPGYKNAIGCFGPDKVRVFQTFGGNGFTEFVDAII